MKQDTKNSLGFLLHDATRLLRKRFEARGSEYGLSSAQWRMLVLLVKEEGASQARLAELLEIEPISVSRLIDRMEDGGWVERRQDASDRRVRMVFATAKAHDAFPFFRPLANVGARVAVKGASYVNFTSNDYLGLATDRRLIEAAVEGTRRYGTGLGSARPQATSVRHEELERRLANWLGYGACACFTTGYQALVGTLSAFLDDDTTVIVDRLAHASIIDGILLARGQHPDLEMRFFKHDSMRSLEKCLTTAEHQKKLVVVEGLYSVGVKGPSRASSGASRRSRRSTAPPSWSTTRTASARSARRVAACARSSACWGTSTS